MQIQDELATIIITDIIACGKCLFKISVLYVAQLYLSLHACLIGYAHLAAHGCTLRYHNFLYPSFVDSAVLDALFFYSYICWF